MGPFCSRGFGLWVLGISKHRTSQGIWSTRERRLFYTSISKGMAWHWFDNFKRCHAGELWTRSGIRNGGFWRSFLPIPSMYGIFIYIWLMFIERLGIPKQLDTNQSIYCTSMYHSRAKPTNIYSKQKAFGEVVQWTIRVLLGTRWWALYNPSEGNTYRVYKRYITPIGWLCTTYRLLQGPEKTWKAHWFVNWKGLLIQGPLSQGDPIIFPMIGRWSTSLDSWLKDGLELRKRNIRKLQCWIQPYSESRWRTVRGHDKQYVGLLNYTGTPSVFSIFSKTLKIPFIYIYISWLKVGSSTKLAYLAVSLQGGRRIQLYVGSHNSTYRGLQLTSATPVHCLQGHL